MISTGELRKGAVIELDNDLWQILDYHHIKMGRGSAQVRITLRNVKRGQTIDRSFQAGHEVAARGARPAPGRVPLPRRRRLPLHGQRLVRPVPPDRGAARRCGELPQGRDDARPHVVPGRDPGRGAPGHGGARWSPRPSPASPATPPRARASRRRSRPGLVVSVPLFVNEGDTVRVDTRTGEYQTRV